MNVNDKCPYDPTHMNKGMIENRSYRYYATCLVCGKSARVIIYNIVGNRKTCQLTKVGRKSTGNAKKVYSIRLDDHEVSSVESGRAKLVFFNNRLRILYKS